MKSLTTKHLGLVLLALALLVQPAFTESTEGEAPELPPVTVSANPLNPSLLEYGKPISVMGEDEIQSRMESTLGETLRLEPGVRSSFFGQGASRPVIRGFAGDRVRVLKNGVTTGDVSDVSEDHVVVADPMQATQIEILRGPETLLYGSGAIGGAVNVTDDSIPEAALGKPFEGQLLGQFGNSADNEKTVGARFRGESGQFNWHISGFTRETDDYEIPGFAESGRLRALEEMEHGHEEEDHEDEDEDHDDEDHDEDHDDDEHGHDEDGEARGKVENTDTDTWGATVGGSYVWDKGFVGVSIGAFDSDYGIPGHAHAEEEQGHDEDEHGHEEEGEEAVRLDVEQVRVDMRGRVDDVSDAIESVKFRVGYADYEHDELEGGAVGTTYERDTVEARVEFVHSPIADLKGAVGFQVLYDDFSALGDEAFLTPVKTWSPALFFFEEKEISDSLDFRFGGRIEAVSHDPDGLSSEDFVPFSLSAGPVWDITGTGDYNLGVTLAYTERAPNAIELFSNGAHLARQIFEIGDSSLDKESSWGVDLVLRKNTGLVTGAFTPFFQSFSNYINLSGTGGEDEGLPVFAYEEIDAYFWGFEFESAFHIDQLCDLGAHGLSLEYQADYVRARNEDVSGDIPRIPPLRNIIRARYSHPESFEALVESVIVEKQDDVAEFELPTDSYSLLNAEVNVKLPFAEENDLRLFVRGTNLTDDEARVHSSFLKDLAPLRGRSVLFGVRFDI